MTRSEILSRYRRLRQISKEQHEAVLDIIAPDVVLDWAKRIDLTQGKTVVSDSEYEIALAEDLAIYLTQAGPLTPTRPLRPGRRVRARLRRSDCARGHAPCPFLALAHRAAPRNHRSDSA
jgi:hypothetical protein